MQLNSHKLTYPHTHQAHVCIGDGIHVQIPIYRNFTETGLFLTLLNNTANNRLICSMVLTDFRWFKIMSPGSFLQSQGALPWIWFDQFMMVILANFAGHITTNSSFHTSIVSQVPGVTRLSCTSLFDHLKVCFHTILIIVNHLHLVWF